MMIKPNWDIFRAKFSENLQYNFEWFCYLLFCKEHDKPFGLFRYKNQSAIETEPIEKGEDIIGWQAKFYDTALSKHKDDFINTIDKAKRDYPDITKLILYTNQEWGQNKGKKPKGLVEIEEKAEERMIQLVWRSESFFEAEFVSVKNKVFAKHFFTSEKSIFNCIEEQQRHSKRILHDIQTCISFNNREFQIDRDHHIEELKDESKQISILSGVGGVGKTVLIKKLYEELGDKTSFFIFKANEFELRNINDLFTKFSFYEFVDAHKDENQKMQYRKTHPKKG